MCGLQLVDVRFRPFLSVIARRKRLTGSKELRRLDRRSLAPSERGFASLLNVGPIADDTEVAPSEGSAAVIHAHPNPPV
eukprot:scaffold25879_cov28-Tisochrysis_lutea.AAC.4